MPIKSALSLSAKTVAMRRRQRVATLKVKKQGRSTELWYKAELLRLVRTMQTITLEELQALKREEYQWARDGVQVGDALPAELTRSIIEAIKKRMSGLDGLAERLAKLAAQRVLGATDAALSKALLDSVKINIAPIIQSGNISKVLNKHVDANVELIKSIPEQYLQKVKDKVMANVQRGQRFESIVADIQKLGDVTESRARLIARDQTSKMNGAFNEARQRAIGINKYVWVTSNDERVREEHAANEGEIFSWDNPPETGHPGEDYQCRCVAQPYIDLDALELELGIAS